MSLLAAAPAGTNTVAWLSTEGGLGRLFYFTKAGEANSPTSAAELVPRERIELAIHPPVTEAAFGGTTMVPLEEYTITVFSTGNTESLLKFGGLESDIQGLAKSLEKYMEWHGDSDENNLTNATKLLALGPGSDTSLLFERDGRGRSGLLVVVSKSFGSLARYRLSHSQVLLIRHGLPSRPELLANAKQKARELTAHNERVKRVLK